MTRTRIRKSLGIVRLGMLAGAAMISVTPAMAAAEPRNYEIEAQALGKALRSFALQSGVQLVFRDKDTHGRTSWGVAGSFEDRDALNLLLKGTGLSAARTGADTYIIHAVAPQSQPEAGSMAPPAQAPAAESDADSQEPSFAAIVVTAQRREQRLQDVPVSVSVVTGEFFSKNNIGDLQDMSVRLPSVRLTMAPAANLLNIRGVGSGLNAGFEQSVGTFVDGVYRGRSRAAAAALFDIERVEVLKGPQSTFFGNNVVAGALNITTRKPSFTPEYSASALYSPSDGEYSFVAATSQPLSDTLAIRVAGKAYGMKGYARNDTLNKDEPRNRDLVGRISLRWEPVDTVRTDLRVDAARLRDHGPPSEADGCPADPAYGPPGGSCLLYLNSGLPVDGTLNYHTNNIGNRFNYDFTEVAFTNAFDLGGVTLTSITSYFHHKAGTLTDADPFPLPGIGGTASRLMIRTLEKVTQRSQELRLTSTGDGPFQYMLGGYYADETLSVLQNVGLYFAPFGLFAGPPYTPATPVAERMYFRQKAETLSAFASVTIKPVENLSIDLSARYSDVTKKIQRDIQIGQGGFIPSDDTFIPAPPATQAALFGVLGGAPGNFANPRHNDHKLMPSAKVSYKFAPDIMGYVSYSKGFKAGGYSITPGPFEFGPETVDAYEAGLKASFLNGRVSTSLALFRGDYKGLQEATNTVNSSGVIVQIVANSAQSRSQGVEFALDAKVARGLSFHTDLSYLDAKYRDYTGAPCTILGSLTPGCVQDMSGKRRGFAPEFSGNVGLSLTQPLTDRIEVRVDPLLYFSSKFFQGATADPLLSQSGYAKFDLRVGVGPADGHWEIAVIGKNLTDRTTASFRNALASSSGTVWLLPERKRSVAVQASIKF